MTAPERLRNLGGGEDNAFRIAKEEHHLHIANCKLPNQRPAVVSAVTKTLSAVTLNADTGFGAPFTKPHSIN
jgi:hypothetical protein